MAGAPDRHAVAPAAIAPPGQPRAERGSENEQEDDSPDDQRADRAAAIAVAAARLALIFRLLRRDRRPLGGLGRRLELLDQRIGAGDDAAGIIGRVGAEMGHDLLVDDLARQCVGHDPFEPVADLDPDLALVGRDQEDDAVIRAALADPQARPSW